LPQVYNQERIGVLHSTLRRRLIPFTTLITELVGCVPRRNIGMALFVGCSISFVGCAVDDVPRVVRAGLEGYQEYKDFKKYRGKKDSENDKQTSSVVVTVNTPPVQVAPSPTPTPAPTPTPEPKQPKRPVMLADNVCKGVPRHGSIPEEEFNSLEPNTSFEGFDVGSFLWKPKSDHGADSVVVVANDYVNSDDLKIAILDKRKKGISNNPDANNQWSRRGNYQAQNTQGDRFCFARIHYRLGRSASFYRKRSPIYACFYLDLDGRKERVKVLGKDCVKISNPIKRCALGLAGDKRCK
jgi:hypothetical protein